MKHHRTNLPDGVAGGERFRMNLSGEIELVIQPLRSLFPNRYNCGNAVFSDRRLGIRESTATDVEIESRESGQTTMKRLLLIVALLLVAVSVGLLFQRVIPWSRQPQLVQPLQQQLDAIAAVKPEFRIFRRRPENNSWDDGSPFDRTTALAILNALVTATPWDGSHAAAYGRHAHTPGIAISLAWCKDIQNDSQRDTQSVHICHGNWLFFYGNHVYQLSEQSHDVLNGIFPKNN